jgi:3-oxoisoapionate kinase
MTDAAPAPPLLGWYGDDFTGATDTLATLAQRGLRAILLTGLPDEKRLGALGAFDAVGIAGATRAMAPLPATAELRPAGAFFKSLGVRVLHYKCCSTFDSAPHVGNLATAAAALQPYFPNRFLPIVGGQPNLGRYCLFGTLFAAASAGGEIFRIDRHPTMRVHPVTPMHEADLRWHLAAQGFENLGLHSYLDYAGDTARAKTIHFSGAVLMDVSREEDLAAIGAIVWRHARLASLLAIGASSVAEALAMNWPRQKQNAVTPVSHWRDAPVFALVGSLSPVTRRQVKAAASFERIDIETARLVSEAGYTADMVRKISECLRRGRHVMAVTAAANDSADGRAADGRAASVGDVAAATARLGSEVLRQAAVGRLVIAGGDTSSQAIKALALWGLSYVGTIEPGVALCSGHSNDPRFDGLEIVLKGGQMGSKKIFEQLAAVQFV